MDHYQVRQKPAETYVEGVPLGGLLGRPALCKCSAAFHAPLLQFYRTAVSKKQWLNQTIRKKNCVPYE
ncbi:MAG: hypothetical protein Q9180_006968 [Flavoplaca navasiana]